MVSWCLSCPDASTDMQHDPFGSWHDLDLRSNFEIDLSRSPWICFEPSWREKHDDVLFIFIPLLGKKLLAISNFNKNRQFLLWWPLEPKLLTWGQIWRHITERASPGLSNAFFGFFLAVIVPELYANLWKIDDFRNFWPIMTSGDPNFDLRRKRPKIPRPDFWRAFDCRLARLSATLGSGDNRGGG